ncbi:hypothetical protein FHR83_006978 [Actinoplanes campanulatus]|uniref:YcxB-like C-terminal domain-containing protein n=1 Tax=Actinoplanes campanulatus TaxID=113559 RepID=A0A7W5AMZ7_9ACTN|nr:YcxB family protein [Actinoplanes campanulatus]MBB3099272.1 hypothetical protein [Actinoplanes campanulatus]GGN40695.1 hypothetical protein GCM10010109_70130 [Actinoplanes campanulatus]GID40590.1 hypothetical protein Aca09nite_70960 [Actinoplanes campanulatus]
MFWHQQRQTQAHPVRYEIDETGVRIQSAHSDSRIAWAGLTWVRTRRHAWLLKNGVVQSAIPRAAFSPEDQAAVDAFLTKGAVRIKA